MTNKSNSQKSKSVSNNNQETNMNNNNTNLENDVILTASEQDNRRNMWKIVDNKVVLNGEEKETVCLTNLDRQINFMGGNGKFFEAHIKGVGKFENAKYQKVTGLAKSKEMLNAFSYLYFDTTHWDKVGNGYFMTASPELVENAYIDSSNVGYISDKCDWKLPIFKKVDGKLVETEMTFNSIARVGFKVNKGWYAILIEEPTVKTDENGEKVKWTDEQWHDFNAVWLCRYTQGLINGVPYSVHPIIRNEVDDNGNITRRGGVSVDSLLSTYLESFKGSVEEMRQRISGKIVKRQVAAEIRETKKEIEESLQTGKKIAIPAVAKTMNESGTKVEINAEDIIGKQCNVFLGSVPVFMNYMVNEEQYISFVKKGLVIIPVK